MEALVGAFRLGAGDESALRLLKHLGMADIPWDAVPKALAVPEGGYEQVVDIAAVERTLQ